MDPELISNKVVEALALLTDNSVGDILYKIGEEEGIDSLIVLALEEFYDKYAKAVIQMEHENCNKEVPDDITILKNCLIEAEVILARAKTNEEKSNATMDVIDLRRSIKRLKEENDDAV